MEILFYILAGLAWLAMFIGGIMLLIAGFRQSVLWGLAMIFLPFAQLIFLFMYWSEAKRAFMIQVLGFCLFAGAVGLAFAAGLRHVTEVATVENFQATLDSPSSQFAFLTPADDDATPAEPDRPDGDYVGMTLDEVCEALGEPKGKLKVGDGVTFIYPGLELYARDGVRVSSQGVSAAGR